MMTRLTRSHGWAVLFALALSSAVIAHGRDLAYSHNNDDPGTSDGHSHMWAKITLIGYLNPICGAGDLVIAPTVALVPLDTCVAIETSSLTGLYFNSTSQRAVLYPVQDGEVCVFDSPVASASYVERSLPFCLAEGSDVQPSSQAAMMNIQVDEIFDSSTTKYDLNADATRNIFTLHFSKPDCEWGAADEIFVAELHTLNGCESYEGELFGQPQKYSTFITLDGQQVKSYYFPEATSCDNVGDPRFEQRSFQIEQCINLQDENGVDTESQWVSIRPKDTMLMMMDKDMSNSYWPIEPVDETFESGATSGVASAIGLMVFAALALTFGL